MNHFEIARELLAVKGIVDKAHGNVRRNESGIPYVFHPFDVMMALVMWGIRDQEMFKAALCHDIKEDTPFPSADLLTAIGPIAYGYVDELTYDGMKHYSKEAYIASFSKRSIQALVIKLADRIRNIREFASAPDHDGYANKYANKAEALFAAYDARVDEVVATFGRLVLKRIDLEIKQLFDYLRDL